MVRRSQGCRNCVRRRVKCDERYPHCIRCSRLRVRCDGVPNKSDWVTYIPADTGISEVTIDQRSRTDYSKIHSHLLALPDARMSAEVVFPLPRICTQNFDPFDSFPPLESSGGTDQIIKYALSSAWPRLIKASSCSESSIAEWSQTMVHSSMLFYANMFGLGSLGAYNGVCTGQDALYMRQECYSKALGFVSKGVNKLTTSSEAPSEELITTVLILSAYNNDPDLRRENGVDCRDSAKSAVDAYYFNLTSSNYCHAAALRTLVHRAGGVCGIRTRGIAHLICLLDLVVASINITRPWYPCRWRSNIARNSPSPSAQDLQIFGISEVDSRVHVFCQMRSLLTALTKTTQNHSTKQNQQDLNSARNEVQYRTLALPDSTFRISALFFSDMVFFPTPVATCTREKLARALRDQLHAESNTSRMNLWISITAAVGLAPETQLSQYFIHLAATQALKLDISDFDSFEAKLCEVLWDTRVVEADLKSIWKRMDVCHARREAHAAVSPACGHSPQRLSR